MTDDCVFCKIIDGEIPGHVVHETENVIAFLDAQPVSRGHTLVVPKEHVEDIHGTADMDFMWDAIVKVSDAIEEVFDPEGIQIAQNNGEKAGQEVFHMHFHVTPVYDGTELEVEYNRTDLDEGHEIAEKLREEV